MHAWSEELAAFSRAIRGLGDFPEAQAAGVSAGIGIYRNNYRGNLQGALAAAYPVVEQLVGADFFRLLARRFIDRHPSRSGNLHHYGAALADFLADFAPAQGLPYLADVARLEWACHCAYFAPDGGELNLARLGRVEAERYPHLRILLHPACRMLRTAHPVAAIWHAHQPGMPADFHIDLDGTPECILVSRTDGAVRVEVLDEADADWLERTMAGATLGDAAAAMLAGHPGFEPKVTLPYLVGHGVVMGFAIQETP